MRVPLQQSIATHIALHLRDRDWDEVSAVTEQEPDPVEWARFLSDSAGDYDWAWINSDQVAVAMGGFRPVGPLQWTAWLVGTPEIASCGVEIHQAAIRTMDMLEACGTLRVSAAGLDGYDEQERWLSRIGMRKEGVARYAGRNNEHLATWAWTYGMPRKRGRANV